MSPKIVQSIFREITAPWGELSDTRLYNGHPKLSPDFHNAGISVIYCPHGGLKQSVYSLLDLARCPG